MELKKLQNKLHSRTNDIEKRTHDFNPLNPQNVKEKRREEGTVNKLEQEKWAEGNETTQKQKRSLTKIVIGVFILLGFLLGGYGFYLYKTKQFSPDNVILSFDAPESIETGREFSFSLLYHNNNRADLKNCQLEITFPESLEIINIDQESMEIGEDFILFKINELSAKKNGTINFKGKIVEKTQAVAYLNATLTYTKGEEENKQTGRQGINILASKILVQLEATRQTASGDLAEYLLRIKNNTLENIEGIEAQLKYPGGFTYVEANIAPAGEGNNIFRLPTLNPGEETEISIKGNLVGSVVEKKIVSAQIGLREEENFTILAEEEAQTEMVSSPLTVQQEILSGIDEKGNTNPGDSLKFKVKYLNSSDLPMNDVVITVSLEGKAIDFPSVSAENGDFNLNQKKIVWRGGKNPSLKTLDPQKEGELSFEFDILSFLPSESLDDKNFEVSVLAQIDSPDVPTPIAANKLIASNQKKIKVNSKVIFESSGFYNDNVIPNFGPIPPKVEKETSYTIHWKIININNDISSTVVKATLPDYILWKENFYPAGARELTFDERTHEVIWEPDKITAQTGTQLAAKEVIFQISITPQETQIDQEPILIDKAILTGTDNFTGKEYKLEDNEPITTKLKDDISVDSSGAKIVE
jgi:hypothetical protein